MRVAPFFCPGADLDLSSNRSFALQYRHRCCTGRNDPLWIPSTIAIFPIEICLQFVLLFVFICSSPWCEQADGSQGIVWKMINQRVKRTRYYIARRVKARSNAKFKPLQSQLHPLKLQFHPLKPLLSGRCGY